MKTKQEIKDEYLKLREKFIKRTGTEIPKKYLDIKIEGRLEALAWVLEGNI